MTPVQIALADGRLDDALELQRALIRELPMDQVNTARAEARSQSDQLLLFELLACAGQWAEARDRLLGIVDPQPGWRESRRRFRQILRAARRREHGLRPLVVGENAPRHLRSRWRAVRALRAGRIEATLHAIDRAELRTPLVRGFIDGREFEGLRDADDRFGSVLETFVGGDYCWVPFERVRRLKFLPMAGLLDQLYRPARLTLIDGIEHEVAVPLVYPNSHSHDGVYSLALDTDWLDVGGAACGIGARIWLIGEEEGPLAEFQQLELRHG